VLTHLAEVNLYAVSTTLRRLDVAGRRGTRNIPLSVRGAVADATVQAEEPPSVRPPRGADDSPPEGEDGSGPAVDASRTDR
jgi:hypothetical protein